MPCLPEPSKYTKRKDGIRHLKMYPCEAEWNAMVAKMKTPQAKEVYKLRQQIMEPVIGDIKENQGESRIAGIPYQRNSRGKDKVQPGVCCKESKENLVISPEERR